MPCSLILASSSPRRKELLALLKIPFCTHSPDANESLPTGIAPADAVTLLASRKAKAIRSDLEKESTVILAADTMVTLGGKLFGKPKSEDDAFQMLCALSGRTHQVYTGVSLLSAEKSLSFSECTDVEFYTLDEAEIRSYIASGEPMDKAGSYGIQGFGALLVKKINGDYFNVVGLPVARIKRELASFL